jgi:hypothetical protein
VKGLRLLAGIGILTLSSCTALGIDPGEEVTYVDPQTGEEVTTTLGDAMADQIEETGAVVASTAGKALGVATGNPVVGISAAALLSALIGTGTSRLRRKKKVVPGSTSGEDPGTEDDTDDV